MGKKKQTDLQRRKAKLGRVYFTQETEDAIVEYNNCEDAFEREILFRERIHPALDKLAENVINRFKFPYINESFEDTKAEVVSFLVLNLHKYDQTKGSKAFSYFSVVAKNYLILNNNKFYKEEIKSTYLADTTNEESFILEEKLIISHDSETTRRDARDLIHLLIQYWDHNLTKVFKKHKDIQIANAIVELMKRSENIDNFNKKALYLMIREMTDAKTVHITKVIKKMKLCVRDQIEQYKRTGYITDPSVFFVYKNE